VTSASGQVSSASQSLAKALQSRPRPRRNLQQSGRNGVHDQQNADNAQQANALSTEARNSATTGAQAVARMNAAIQQIQRSSDETAKIIKVIDEIAFQTNLLALNAAVEAARAGRGRQGLRGCRGRGPQPGHARSAEAAKNTANMIQESVKNSKNGVDIAAEVTKVLDEIVRNVGKATDLVSEIAAASQEQGTGHQPGQHGSRPDGQGDAAERRQCRAIRQRFGGTQRPRRSRCRKSWPNSLLLSGVINRGKLVQATQDAPQRQGRR